MGSRNGAACDTASPPRRCGKLPPRGGWRSDRREGGEEEEGVRKRRPRAHLRLLLGVNPAARRGYRAACLRALRDAPCLRVMKYASRRGHFPLQSSELAREAEPREQHKHFTPSSLSLPARPASSVCLLKRTSPPCTKGRNTRAINTQTGLGSITPLILRGQCFMGQAEHFPGTY